MEMDSSILLLPAAVAEDFPNKNRSDDLCRLHKSLISSISSACLSCQNTISFFVGLIEDNSYAMNWKQLKSRLLNSFAVKVLSSRSITHMMLAQSKR